MLKQEKQLTTVAEERHERTVYERPRIEDYGTLTELTASKGPERGELFGAADKGGGGYS